MAGEEYRTEFSAEIAAVMEASRRLELGRKTLAFVKRAMQDPVIRDRIQARAAQIRRESAGGSEVST
jgi:hypothetical protein